MAAGPLTEWISLGLLAGSVPRDVIDEAVAACDRAPKRAGGKLLITLTRCRGGWPRRYRTYYQETEAPFRRAEPATVYRLGTHGLVIGRWTSRADGEHQALTDALGARPAAVFSSEGRLLPNYRNSLES